MVVLRIVENKQSDTVGVQNLEDWNCTQLQLPDKINILPVAVAVLAWLDKLDGLIRLLRIQSTLLIQQLHRTVTFA